MKILNIHGYKGNAANSAYAALSECGFDVLSLQIDYDRKSPEAVAKLLNNQFANYFCDAVVGTSLGGFYAALVSAKNECPAVLINPCLMPFMTLPELGYNNKEGIMEYIKLFSGIADAAGEQVATIVGGRDEVIGSHDFTEKIFGNDKYIVVPDGKHSGATMPLADIFTERRADFFGNMYDFTGD